MSISSQLLLNFLLNAVWQIALIAALASAGAWLLRYSAARYRHLLWVSALCLAVLVPAVTSWRAMLDSVATAVATVETSFAREPIEPFALSESSEAPAVSLPVFQLSRNVALALIALYAAFLLYRAFRLAQAWQTTRAIKHLAHELEPDENVAAVINQCESEFATGSRRVKVLCSETLPVPVTMGFFQPVIILPDALLREGNIDLLTSAIGHEFVHVARQDYLLNFIYELVYLPVSFHPAAALLGRRIKQTRELCCDQLVAERILNAETYARSLIRLAGSAPTLRRLSVTTTVGIADADILEARIMSLLTKPKMTTRWKKMSLVAVSLLLVVPCVAAAAFAMRFDVETNAQDPVQEDQARKEKEKFQMRSREERTQEALKEGDSPFSRERVRRQEFEMEMRAVKQAALVRLARITMEQAIQIATSQQPGKVLVCSLDAEHWEEPGKLAKDGTVFYQVVIADETNAGATHVRVNALDGTILKIEKELPRKMRSPERQ
jgi:beta-lactamase regulating signal transducer with metallopeptidase domain